MLLMEEKKILIYSNIYTNLEKRQSKKRIQQLKEKSKINRLENQINNTSKAKKDKLFFNNSSKYYKPDIYESELRKKIQNIEPRSTRNNNEINPKLNNLNNTNKKISKNSINFKKPNSSKSNILNEKYISLAKDNKKLAMKLQSNIQAKPSLSYPYSKQNKLNNDLNSQMIKNPREIGKLFKAVDKNQNKTLGPEDSLLLADKLGKCAENLLKLKEKLQSNIQNGNLNEEQFIKMAIDLGIQ